MAVNFEKNPNAVAPKAKATSTKSSGTKSTAVNFETGQGAPSLGGGGLNFSLGGAIKNVTTKILGSAPVKTALGVIDLPRSLVVSTVKEGLDAAHGKGFSVTDLSNQTKHHIGAGQVLQEYAPNANINVKRALGLVGDVGLDPLTYLTFGASAVGKGAEGANVAEKGLKAGTRLSAKDVADEAIRLGRNDLANTVLKKRTASGLGEADKAALGIKTAPRFGLGSLKVDVPFLEPITKMRAAVLNPVLNKVGGSKLGKAILSATDTFGKDMVELRAKDPAAARQVVRAARLSEGVGQGLEAGALKDLTALHEVHFKGTNPDAVRQMIEDPAKRLAVHASDLDRQAAEALSTWYEVVRQKAEQATGRTIPAIENYLPHQMTQEFKDALDSAGVKDAARPKGREPFTAMREYTPSKTVISDTGQTVSERIGKPWFGVPLQTGSIDEMEGIAKKALGENYKQVFRSDPWEIGAVYATSVGRMVKEQGFMKGLEDSGLVQHFNPETIKAAQVGLGKPVKPLTDIIGAAAPEAPAPLAAVAEQAKTAAVDTAQRFDQAGLATNGWDQHVASIAARTDPAGVEAKQLAQAAATQPEPALADVAKLESVAAAATPTTNPNWSELTRGMDTTKGNAIWERMTKDGLAVQLASDPTKWADPNLAQVLVDISNKAEGAQVGNFLKTYDTLLNRWKGYALLSPGFHVRNYMGAQWNNWMAGIDAGTQFKNVRAMHWYKRGGVDAVAEHMGKEWGDIYAHADRLGVWGGHDIRDFADINSGGFGRHGLAATAADKFGHAADSTLSKLDKFDPTASKFGPLNANYSAAERVERLVRSELFVDRMLKGFTPEAAMDTVIKYHFDYGELSQLEQKWAKRVVPFYTWTRKNLPLQIENYVKNPGKFNRFMDVKRNVELGQTPDAVVPGYFHDLLGIRTPFTPGSFGVGGATAKDPIYVTPDLPINRLPGLGESFSDTFWNGLSPFFKLPQELKGNINYFSHNPLMSKGEGTVKIPTTWAPLAPILYQLNGLGGLPKVVREDGHYRMNRREAYKIESVLPVLARMSKLTPNTPKYQDRALTTWLSTGLGVSTRTLTADEIKSEMAKRRG